MKTLPRKWLFLFCAGFLALTVSAFIVSTGSSARPLLSTAALEKLKLLGFVNPNLLSPFYSTAWIKEIENLPLPTAMYRFEYDAANPTTIHDYADSNLDLTLSSASAWVQKGDRLQNETNMAADFNPGFENWEGVSGPDNYLGNNLLVNGDFEAHTSNGTDDVDDWTKYGMTESSYGTTAPRNGSGHGVVVDDNIENWEGLRQPITLTSNTPYRYSVYIRSSTGTAKIDLSLTGLSDANYDDGSGTTYVADIGITYDEVIKYFKTGTDTSGIAWMNYGNDENDTGTFFADDAFLGAVLDDTPTNWTLTGTQNKDGSFGDMDTANETGGTYAFELHKGTTATDDVTATGTITGFTSGNTYFVAIQAMSDGTGTGSISISGVSGATDAVADTDTSMVWHDSTFTATATSHDVVITSETAGGSVFYDNLIIYPMLPDAVSPLPLSPGYMMECNPMENFKSYDTTYYASLSGTPVEAGGDLNFDGATAGTWMGWVYFRSDGENTQGKVMYKNDAFIIHSQSTDELAVALGDSGGWDWSVTTTSPLTITNSWYFIVAIYDGSQSLGNRKKLYVGDLQGNLTLQTLNIDNVESSIIDNGNNIYFGDNSPNDRAFNGLFAFYSIHNGTALSVDQIRAYQRLSGGVIAGVAPRADIGFDDPLLAFLEPERFYRDFMRAVWN